MKRAPLACFAAIALLAFVLLGCINASVLNNKFTPENATASSSNNIPQEDYRIMSFRSDFFVQTPNQSISGYSDNYVDLVNRRFIHIPSNGSLLQPATTFYTNGTTYKYAVVNGKCLMESGKQGFFSPLLQDSDVIDLGFFLSIEAMRNSSSGQKAELYRHIKQTDDGAYKVISGPHSPYDFTLREYGGLYLGQNVSINQNGISQRYAYSNVQPISKDDFDRLIIQQLNKLIEMNCKSPPAENS